MNPVLESLFKHQSIRKYKNQPLEQEKLDLIIKAAQAAPNWCNAQHVTIIAIKDQKRKERFAELCNNQDFIGTCSVFLVFCADYYRTTYAFQKNGNAELEKNYVKQLDTLLVGSHEAGIAMQNAVVAAESMGLGTVPIGSIRRNSLDVVKELNLPQFVIPIVGLCVGYPDDNPGIKPRLPAKAVYFEDKYDTTNIKSDIDEFDNEYQKYLANRSSNERDGNCTKSVNFLYNRNYGKYENDYELFKQQGFITINKN